MRYLIIFLSLFLSGCVITIEHKTDEALIQALTNTKSENKIVYEKCHSASLDLLLNLEKIDIAEYKKRKDFNGLTKAAFRQLEKRQMLLDLANEDIKKCFTYK